MNIDPLEYLCWYDPRHPNYASNEFLWATTEGDECYCDNCFYGRTKLAEEIISLREQLSKLEDNT